LLAGDAQTVIVEAKRLQENPGFEAQGHLLAGLLFVRAGRLQQALQELLIASRNETTAVEAMTAASECFYRMDRFADAVETSRRALDRDPNALDARRWLASAYYDLGATLDAVGELKAVSAQAPSDYGSERLLALIAKDTERFGEAVQHYREALRRRPDPADLQEVLVELSECLVKLSRFDEAAETLRGVKPTAEALTLKADCAHHLGQTDAALEGFLDAIRLDPKYFPAYLKRGTLLLSLGRVQESAALLQDAARLDPHNSQAHFHLSQAYSRLGEQQQAAHELQLMQQAQALEREFTELHEAAAEDPNNVEARFRIGQIAVQLGRPDLAEVWFHAALALQPDHVQARAALARLDASERP